MNYKALYEILIATTVILPLPILTWVRLLSSPRSNGKNYSYIVKSNLNMPKLHDSSDNRW